MKRDSFFWLFHGLYVSTALFCKVIERHIKKKDSNKIGLERLISSILVKWFILPSIDAHLCAAVPSLLLPNFA